MKKSWKELSHFQLVILKNENNEEKYIWNFKKAKTQQKTNVFNLLNHLGPVVSGHSDFRHLFLKQERPEITDYERFLFCRKRKRRNISTQNV